MPFSKHQSLDRLANKMLNQTNLMHKLADLAGRKNYPGKLKRLEKKVQEELELWERKESSPKLLDLKKDLNFIQSQMDQTDYNKERIDLLTTKYSISYGEIGRSSI